MLHGCRFARLIADDFASPGYRPRPSIGYCLRKVEVATTP